MSVISSTIQRSRQAFTLVEILIVVMILGILTVLVLPHFSAASDEARYASAKDQLRIMREQIGVFRAQHQDRWPGLTAAGLIGPNDLFARQLTTYTDLTGNTSPAASATHKYGPYLHAVPKNPISGLKTVTLDTNVTTPTADGTTGWIYQPRTGRLFLNSTGQDPDGTAYLDY